MARLTEEIEAESMSRVCPDGVRVLLRTGRTWLTKAAAKDLFINNPFVHEVLICEDPTTIGLPLMCFHPTTLP